jgi:hypothetical protein
MPAMFQLPSTIRPLASCVSGTSGAKCVEGMSPVSSGTSAISISGISEVMPSTMVVRAERRMPPCWMANTVSRIARPTTKVALMRITRPVLMPLRSSSVICQC